VGIVEGEGAEGAHLGGLAFEAAMHALRHFRALLVEQDEGENAHDDELEQNEGGHELAANRAWFEQRHSWGTIPPRQD
jgi:ATP-dependent 26S proteasome regulatory subunit